MASIYAKGKRLYGRLRRPDGQWVSEALRLPVGKEREALAAVRTAQARLDAVANAEALGASAGPMTVGRWAKEWLARKLADGHHTHTPKSRINRWVVPEIGAREIASVEPDDIARILARLKAAGYAERTRLVTYRMIRTLFSDANRDPRMRGMITNPCVLPRKDAPRNIDHDREWRNDAMYTVPEILTLLTDERIPEYRRVTYALKALAGLRHGEAAALHWRHYDPTVRPLGRILVAQAWDSIRLIIKEPKTGVERRIPVHPMLARILDAWRASGWEKTYGRAPTEKDIIVPGPRTPGGYVCVSKAAAAMRGDLAAVGLRVTAGNRRTQNGRTRARGGHDLRAWTITHAQSCGAHRDIFRVVTHSKPSDVVEGYTRTPWPVLCAEILKLALDGNPDGPATGHATGGGNRGNHSGIPGKTEVTAACGSPTSPNVTSSNHTIRMFASCTSRGGAVATLLPEDLAALEAAILTGDPIAAAELASAMAAPQCIGCGSRHRPTVDCA